MGRSRSSQAWSNLKCPECGTGNAPGYNTGPTYKAVSGKELQVRDVHGMVKFCQTCIKARLKALEFFLTIKK
jgi:hypothetical protein